MNTENKTTTALIGRRPCGCVGYLKEDTKHWENIGIADGYTVERMDSEEAVKLYVQRQECTHGTNVEQLAALVRKQASRIAELEAEINGLKEQIAVLKTEVGMLERGAFDESKVIC